MYEGRIVFTQLMDFLPRHTFRRRVKRYGGDRRVRTFTCWNQFLAMAFAQLTYRESLRDIEACLGAAPEKLYHMGFRAKVSRSTLADANETRDWRIYADFAQTLITDARRLYADEPLAAELGAPSTHSTRPQSTSASRSSRGRASVGPRAPSRCTRSWISPETSRPSHG